MRGPLKLKHCLALVITVLLSRVSAQENRNVLFLGASIISGYGVEREYTIPRLLESKMIVGNGEIHVKNMASPGASSEHALTQFGRALTGGFVPDVLFIGLGLSDAVYQINPSKIRSNLAQLIALARSTNQGMKIFLFNGKIFQRHVTSLVPAGGSDYEEAYEQVFTTLEEEQGITLLPFILTPIEGDMAFFQLDKLHPNAQGMEKISSYVWEIIEPEL